MHLLPKSIFFVLYHARYIQIRDSFMDVLWLNDSFLSFNLRKWWYSPIQVAIFLLIIQYRIFSKTISVAIHWLVGISFLIIFDELHNFWIFSDTKIVFLFIDCLNLNIEKMEIIIDICLNLNPEKLKHQLYLFNFSTKIMIWRQLFCKIKILLNHFHILS